MAQKDISQKLLEDYEDVFADIVNVLVFGGKEVVRPEALEPSNIRSQYKAASDGLLHEQERDVAKYWKDGEIHIGLIGLENQIKPEREMVLRVLGYDGTAYRDQLNHKTKQKQNKKAFVPYPVLTLILYFGSERWNMPITLKELLNLSGELDDYISDYRINVFEIAWLDDETVSKFTSDFRIVADFFVQKRKNKSYQPGAEKIRHVDALLKLLTAFTGDPAYGEAIPYVSKGEVTMCSVVEQFKNEGMELGLEQGMEQGLKQGMAQGLELGLKKAAENMLAQGCGDELILSVTGITQEYLDTIKSTVRQSD